MAKRAAQRVDLMCVAQADLRPDPRCLDGAPAGAMQLVHRESVVQFINEVRARAPAPAPAPPTPRARSRRLMIAPRYSLREVYPAE